MNTYFLIGLAFIPVYIVGFIYLWVQKSMRPDWDDPFRLPAVSLTGRALLIGLIGMAIIQCTHRH